MTRQQAEQFINAYNMLLTINTKGEDTRTMAKVLDLLEQLAGSIQLLEETAPLSLAPTEENSTIEEE